MSLAQQIADVGTLTNRPDLVAEITLAVKAATLKAHHTDYYGRDLYENSFACATEEYVQSVDYTSLLGTRFRALSYMRKQDPDTGLNVGNYFDIITPDNALDAYGYNRVNSVYLAGNLWVIRTDEVWQYFTIGYYISPDVTDASYSSWIDTMVPTAITYEAARVIFKSIGNDALEQKYSILAGEAYLEVAKMGVQLSGY